MQFNVSDLESPLSRANEYLLKRKNSKAIKYLNRLLEENDLDDYAWLLLGIAKRRLGALNEAIRCFKIAIEINKSLLEAWGLLTITYLDKNKENLAKRTIDKASRLNPENEKIQFYSKNLIRIYKKFGPFF